MLDASREKLFSACSGVLLLCAGLCPERARVPARSLDCTFLNFCGSPAAALWSCSSAWRPCSSLLLLSVRPTAPPLDPHLDGAALCVSAMSHLSFFSCVCENGCIHGVSSFRICRPPNFDNDIVSVVRSHGERGQSRAIMRKGKAASKRVTDDHVDMSALDQPERGRGMSKQRGDGASESAAQKVYSVAQGVFDDVRHSVPSKRTLKTGLLLRKRV